MPASPATEWCEVCGTGPMHKGAMSGHLRSKAHAKRVAGVGSETVPPLREGADHLVAEGAGSPLPTTKGQAIIPGWRRATRLSMGQRSITMLRPVCRICQRTDNVPWDWYTTCPHDPYVTVVTRRVNEPEYGPENPDGSREVIGTRVVETYEVRPNVQETALTMRVNSGDGVIKARKKGFILPSELRSPAYPGGIADACQFRDCKYQQGLVAYRNGTYCREIEALLVAIDEQGEAFEVELGTDVSRKVRERQLAEARTMV